MPIHVEIVTPSALPFSGEAKEVRAPGFLGEFGVLPEHSPFLSVVRSGVVTIDTEEGEHRFVVGRGFAEAGPDRLTILAEVCEPADGVDRDAAKALLDESERTMATADPTSGEFRNAERNADLARARLAAG
jgi:F-type H+-transporting ATPase subunit epsilon